MSSTRVVFIAGPTAGGKSAAALRLAGEIGGEVVNADAIQVYRDLRIVSARPSPADEAAARHHLYGVLDGAERCSAGRWARMAAAVIDDIRARNAIAIVVGGTGLYFKALLQGLSPIPDVSPQTRALARERRKALGPDAFRKEVLARDPGAAHLPAGDAQRLMRAWEVFEAAGKPLSHFQTAPRQPLLSGKVEKILIAPPRETLYARCDARANAMLDHGAAEEARALLARGLDPSLPVMKALGVAEIGAWLRGEASEEDALAALQQNTRRFAKRQMTWFRRQTPDWPRYENADDAVRAAARRS